MIYFPETTAIKRVRCVNFPDSYDNSLLSKLDKNTEFPVYLITYDVQPKDNLNTKGEGQITCYPIQQRKRPNFFVVENFEFGGVDYCCTLSRIPANYSEVVNSVDSNNWILATKTEFDSLVENNTFQWQKAPRNENIVGSRWFFITKSKSDRSHEYKAHFVAKGYLQIYGKDYGETFTMTNMASIRLLLQITVQYDLLINHIDVQSAYLNAPLDYKIYVEPSEGFKGKNGNYVWKLKKSLYELKQSS